MGEIILNTVSALYILLSSWIYLAINSLILHFFWSFYILYAHMMYTYSNKKTSRRSSLRFVSNTFKNFQRFWMVPYLMSSLASFKIWSKIVISSFSALCGPNMIAISWRLQARGFLTRWSLILNNYWNSFYIYGHFSGPYVCNTAGKLNEHTCNIFIYLVDHVYLLVDTKILDFRLRHLQVMFEEFIIEIGGSL